MQNINEMNANNIDQNAIHVHFICKNNQIIKIQIINKHKSKIWIKLLSNDSNFIMPTSHKKKLKQKIQKITHKTTA